MDLAGRAQPPGALVSVHPHEPTQESARGRCLTGDLRLRLRQLAGDVKGEICPGRLCVDHSLFIGLRRQGPNHSIACRSTDE
jgi:hypothetical protein